MDIKITKEEFTKLFYEKTFKELCTYYNVKESQIIRVAKELGLKKPKGKKPMNRLVIE